MAKRLGGGRSRRKVLLNNIARDCTGKAQRKTDGEKSAKDKPKVVWTGSLSEWMANRKKPSAEPVLS